MTDLNENEQAHLDRLELDFKMSIAAWGTDFASDFLEVVKTDGNVPWKTMVAFCEAHNTAVPDWAEESKH